MLTAVSLSKLLVQMQTVVDSHGKGIFCGIPLRKPELGDKKKKSLVYC